MERRLWRTTLGGSKRPQPRPPRGHHSSELGERRVEDRLTFTSDLVGATAVVSRERRNEPALLETTDGPVESAWTKANIGEHGDVLHQRVPVFRACGEAREHEKQRPRKRFVPRSFAIA